MSSMNRSARIEASGRHRPRVRSPQYSKVNAAEGALLLDFGPIGRRCGLSAADLVTLALAAQLHDLRKIGIPDRVSAG